MSELPKVLFVDDESAILDDMRRISRNHFNAFYAESVDEAISLYKSDGPFAVVVTDQKMPGKDGSVLLSEIKMLDANCSTILLTGNADYSDAMQAVNEGHVFRLLSKPSSSKFIRDSINDGVRHRELIEAEKVLLHETLVGAVNALTETLAIVKPIFFGRAKRVRRLAGEVARVINVPNVWQIETAAVFTQLPSITFPDEEAQNIFLRKELSKDTKKIVEKVPQVMKSLLGHVPRLEKVRAILDCLLVNEIVHDHQDDSEVIEAYEILRTALEFDYLETDGHEEEIILATLRSSPKQFPQHIIDTIERQVLKSKSRYVLKEIPAQRLKVGMRLAEDLRLVGQLLVAPKGTDITEHLLFTLNNFISCHTRSPFPEMIKVFARVEIE